MFSALVQEATGPVVDCGDVTGRDADEKEIEVGVAKVPFGTEEYRRSQPSLPWASR